MESVFIKFGYKLFKLLSVAYEQSFLSQLIISINQFLKNIILGSGLIQWFSSNKGLNRSLDQSVFKKYAGLKVPEGLKQLFMSSQILKVLLNKRVLTGLIMLQILTYIILPTTINVVLSACLIGLMLFHGWLYVEQSNEPSLVVVGMFTVMAFFIVSYMLSPIRSDGFTILIIYLSTFLFASFLLGVFNDRNFFERILHLLAVMVFMTGIYGIYQRIVGAPIDPAWLDENATSLGVRVYSVFGNPNVYGEFLVLLLPLVFAGFNLQKNNWIKFGYFIAFSIGFLNVLLTLSRGSMLSLGLALMLIILFKDRKYLPLVVVGVLLSPFFVPESIIQRIMTIFQGGDTSTSYRVSIYTASLDMLRDFFVEGTGLGNFKVLYKAYAYSAAKSFHAHNTLLMLFIEMGIMGIIAWGYYFFVWTREIFDAQKTKGVYGYYAFAAFVGVLGCTIQGMVDHIFHNYDILFFYILIMTIGVIASKAAKEVRNESEN